jgi:hypothetical protein
MIFTAIPIAIDLNSKQTFNPVGHHQTYIIRLSDISVIQDKEHCELTIETGVELPGLEIGKTYIIANMITRDPTPETAFDVVSLAFMMQKWSFMGCMLASKKPYRFTGWKKLYHPEVLLEMWEHG